MANLAKWAKEKVTEVTDDTINNAKKHKERIDNGAYYLFSDIHEQSELTDFVIQELKKLGMEFKQEEDGNTIIKRIPAYFF